MMRKFKFLALFFLIPLIGYAQMHEPTKWRYSINDAGEIVFTAITESGWHLYDTNLDPNIGPIPTTFVFEEVKGAELTGKPKTSAKTHTEYDDMFGANVTWYETNPTFVQKMKITNPDAFKVEGYLEFMSCNDEGCVRGNVEFSFTKKDLSAKLLATIKPAAEVKDEPAPVVEPEPTATEDISATEEPQQTSETVAAAVPTGEVDLWKPVIKEMEAYGIKDTTSDKSLLAIFLLCFGGGFIALLTPCVWPIIPMTVSFFLKRSSKNRKKAVQDAVIYGLSIIVIFLVLGLAVTGIFGASALNELSTSALFNLIFFALLVLFAVSFFGAFELTLPQSWVNKMDSKAETTSGILSIFFMAFTLVLVSFSCTGPIIGALLVQAASMGSLLGPAVGMFGFGLALAIPFAFFAIFPSFLKDLPKSGGWLNSVKVVLGFLELALALKFLSVADLAYGWHILDREVFLVLWIVIFVLLGSYLLGKVKFSHDSDLKSVSVPRLFMAIISFAFAIYMVPGLWGAPLKAISAFSPPLYTQDFNLYDGEVHPKSYDYEEGMALAVRQNKPVLIDFTGYGCVNCREMEASVWSDPRVKGIIDNDFVLVSLYVDDKTKLDEPIEIIEDGKTRKLRTVGDKWSYLQRQKFGANAQPYYVVLDHEGMPLAPYRVYKKDIDEYIDFLKVGLDNYKK